MPFDEKGRWYSDPETGTAFEVAPRYATATGNSGVFNAANYDSISAQLGLHGFRKTALAGTHNDLIWFARTPGTTPLSITYVVSGNNTALTIVKTADDLIVNAATDGAGVATTTAQQIIDYVKGNEAASAVEAAADVILAPTNDGTGVIVALAEAAFQAPQGTTPTLDVSLEQTEDGSTFFGAAAFAQKTATLTTERKVFGPFAEQVRWLWTITGTNPEYVFSIGAEAKSE